MSIEEWMETYLVEKSFEPEHAAEILSDNLDNASKKSIMEYMRNEYSLTDQPGRRSMKYCLRCNPHLNGKYGKDGTESIGKYYVPDENGVAQYRTGWEGVCKECASHLVNSGFEVEPLPEYENHELFEEEEEVEHECVDPSWTKYSMVTESGGFDWVRCDECNIWAKRWGMGDIEVVGHER